MPAIRTQIYLSSEQRRRIDMIVQTEGVTLAAVVRRALDAYLADVDADPADALRATFGADPHASAPDRSTWDRG